MPSGYFVIRVPSGFDLHRMMFNPRANIFTYNGRHNRLMTEFIEDGDIGLDTESQFLGSIISEYEAELCRLKEDLEEKGRACSTLESELTEERASMNDAQKKLRELDLTNQDLTERLSKDKGWSLGARKEQTKTVTELLSRIDELEALLDKSRASNGKLSKKLDEVAARNDELTEENKALKTKVEGLRGLYDKNLREFTSLKADFKEQRERIASLSQNLEDVERTNRHLRNERNDMMKVDVRGIVTGFLQYATDVSNATLDKKDADLRGYLEMKTEYLEMSLKGIGLEIIHHGRGSDLSNARVDIQPVETDNPELDGKVKMSDRFGCRFNTDFFAEIPECITVYSLKRTEGDDAIAVSEENQENVGEEKDPNTVPETDRNAGSPAQEVV